MGEKTDKKKKSADAGGVKTADGGAVVLKLDLHCEGCAKKVKSSIRRLEGVETVTVDISGNRLTVTGKVDAVSIKERVELKTKKKVEIISPQQKKDGGGDKKADEKPSEKKSDEKKTGDKKPKEKEAESEKKSDGKKAGDKKPKEAESTTVVLTIPLHCDGCIHKIKRTISKIKGVELVIPEADKDLVTVKGTMDAKELAPYLSQKFKRSVDIVPSKKGDSDKKDKDKKDEKTKKGEEENVKKGKEAAKGGEAKAAVGGGGGDGSRSVEVANKLDYYGQIPYTYTMPMYNQDYHNHDYGVPASSNYGYVTEYSQVPPPPPPMYLRDPRVPDVGMFSDENPDACSVM